MTTFNKIYKATRIWILLIIAILLPKFVNRYYLGVVNIALIFGKIGRASCRERV